MIKNCQFQTLKHWIQGGFYFEQLNISLEKLKSWTNRAKFLKLRRSWKSTLFWRKKQRVLDYKQPNSIETFHKFHHNSLINKNQAFVFDCEWMMQTQDKNIKSKNGTERQSLWFVTKICRRKNSNLHMFQLVWISFIQGYHVHQHICTSVEGETYSCTRKPGNEQDCNAVAVMYEVAGHIPLAISKCISLFSTLPR